MDTALQGKPLETYLNDHLAGSTGGLELVRRMARQSEDTQEKTVLEDIAREIEEERAVLKDTMRSLDCSESAAKKAAGWLLDKLSEVKLSPSLHDHDLARVLEFEALSAGVAGKRCLWKNLSLLRSKDERVQQFNYAALGRLAESQIERLDTLRERLV